MKQSLYNLMKESHRNNMCVMCDGRGFVALGNTCDECSGTGFGTILPRKDSDIALKQMLSTIDSDFMRDIPLGAVKKAFELVPSSEVIYENDEEDIMVIKLFEYVFIAFDINGVKWIQY